MKIELQGLLIAIITLVPSNLTAKMFIYNETNEEIYVRVVCDNAGNLPTLWNGMGIKMNQPDLYLINGVPLYWQPISKDKNNPTYHDCPWTVTRDWTGQGHQNPPTYTIEFGRKKELPRSWGRNS